MALPALPNLIPMSTWKWNVRAVVTPAEWKNIQKQCFRKAGYRCEQCGGVGPSHPVECHERWHFDDIKHVQTLLGVIALCPNCHRLEHLGNTERIGMLKPTLDHAAKIFKVPRQEVDMWSALAFQLWHRRSQYPWTVQMEPVLSQLG